MSLFHLKGLPSPQTAFDLPQPVPVKNFRKDLINKIQPGKLFNITRIKQSLSKRINSPSLQKYMHLINPEPPITINFSKPLAGRHLIQWQQPVSEKQLEQNIQGYLHHAWYSCFKAGLQASLVQEEQIHEQLCVFLNGRQDMHQLNNKKINQLVAKARRTIRPDYVMNENGGYFKAYKNESGVGKRLDATQIRTTNGKVFELLKTPTQKQVRIINRALGKTFIKGVTGVKLLGKGGFGIIVLARDIDTGTIVAVKKIKNAEAANAELQSYKLIGHREGLVEEIGHSHSSQLKGNKRDDHYYLVMPFFEKGNGEAASKMIQHIQFLNPDRAAIVLKDIARSYTKPLVELHEADIAHRDVKPDNYFHSETYGIALGDFGFVSNLKLKQRLTFKGTTFYLPPEVRTSRYNAKKHDAFSLGMTLLELKLGCMPIDNPGPHLHIQGNPVTLKFNQDICAALDSKDIPFERLNYDNLDEIIAGLLNRNVKSRFLPVDALRQPYFMS